LPIGVQIELLNKLIHRDLSNQAYKTNLHLHYNIPYPVANTSVRHDVRSGTFFRSNPKGLLEPKDVSVHKSINIQQMLERRLRWVTLGGQYDWTAKVYPSEKPPEFPPDIGKLIHSLWPDVNAQAAIVNFYTPGDTLSVHRDVSEECDHGLVSISIGCDGIFVIGNNDGSKHVTLRLRSGDALLMSGESRFAWHAVPKILPQTCPREIQDWPVIGTDTTMESWKGWLTNKRINLNVRQMNTN
jgi:DNA alkylation damage repair protein AlkB